jgi:hypothetical protein
MYFYSIYGCISTPLMGACRAGGFFRAGVDAASIFLPTGKKVVSVVNKNGLQDSFTTDKVG